MKRTFGLRRREKWGRELDAEQLCESGVEESIRTLEDAPLWDSSRS